MAASPETFQKHDITLDEYLKIEEETGVRHEWVGGEVRAMAGASYAHNTIAANIMRVLGNELRGKGCQPFSNDMRVRIPVVEARTYPDVLVACPPFEWDEKLPHTLLNPRVIFEILSAIMFWLHPKRCTFSTSNAWLKAIGGFRFTSDQTRFWIYRSTPVA